MLLSASCASLPPTECPGPATPGVLVLNKAANTAWLLNPDSGRVMATLQTGAGPHEVAGVGPGAGPVAVVANYGTREAPGSTLSVLDFAQPGQPRTIGLGEYRRPHGIAWLPGGEHVVVTAEANRALLLVNIASGTVEAAIPTGQQGSHMVAVSPDGRRAYVANIGSGSVTAIDIPSRSPLKTVPTGRGAEGIAVTPDGREVWVTNREDDTISILNAETLEVVATLPSADFPIRVQITPDGRQALVSNARSSTLRVFDVASRREIATIPMRFERDKLRESLLQFEGSSTPIGILIAPDGRRAYVANANADAITLVDLERHEIVDYFATGREPDGLAYIERSCSER